MKGLTLSRSFFDTCGQEAMKKAFPALVDRMAFGLCGEGSECFGFDDALSRDHDWGPGFCIWMDDADYRQSGAAVQAVYCQALQTFPDAEKRKDTGQGAGRVGVLSIQNWYQRYTGLPEGPETLAEWRPIPEAFLATATNGEVFQDNLGLFSRIRNHLLQDYPEDLRIKKIAARAAVMAQAGQYNYPRCLKRGEKVAGQLALAEFIKAGLSMVYLLNKRYAPFYKWMHRGIKELPVLPRAYALFAELAEADENSRQEIVEGICMLVVGELKRQGLTEKDDAFLQEHCDAIMAQIQDSALRKTHVMEV